MCGQSCLLLLSLQSLRQPRCLSRQHLTRRPAGEQPKYCRCMHVLLQRFTSKHRQSCLLCRTPLLDSEMVNKHAVGKPASEGKRKANGTAANPFARVKSAKVNKV